MNAPVNAPPMTSPPPRTAARPAVETGIQYGDPLYLFLVDLEKVRHQRNVADFIGVMEGLLGALRDIGEQVSGISDDGNTISYIPCPKPLECQPPAPPNAHLAMGMATQKDWKPPLTQLHAAIQSTRCMIVSQMRWLAPAAATAGAGVASIGHSVGALLDEHRAALALLRGQAAVDASLLGRMPAAIQASAQAAEDNLRKALVALAPQLQDIGSALSVAGDVITYRPRARGTGTNLEQCVADAVAALDAWFTGIVTDSPATIHIPMT